MPIKQSFPTASSPQPWQPLFYSDSLNLTILDASYRWNHIIFVLVCWVISFSIISLRFIHITAGVKLSSFLRLNTIPLYDAAESFQSCPTLCNPIDGSPSGSPVPGILQARTLEWVAISFSSAWQWKVKVKSLSCVWLLATPWTAAHQAPPSMGFSRQEYWSGCHCLLHIVWYMCTYRWFTSFYSRS